ncbi:MAG: hypothetical protein EBZ77_06000, partial [Chitinophagia bacterium]|nr:hypothetical protein [Chitinophagia bacterium]
GLKKIMVEKAPFFLISLICGGFAFYTQRKTGAVADFGVLTLQERFMYAAYGFIQYVKKFFLPDPGDLSTFYPYPYRYITGWLPWIYYAAPFIAVAILSVPLWIKRSKYPQTFRVVLFGIAYLFCNLVFVLQFISVGAAIMADRYSYVAYIGPLFLVPYLMYLLIERFNGLKTTAIVGMCAITAVLSVFCYQRTYAWHDAETLLSDAISKYPYRALLSYKWLGHYYFGKGDYDKALENYNVLITLHAADKKVEDKVNAINVLKSTGGQLPQMNIEGAPQAANVANADSFQKYIDSSFYYCTRRDSLKAFRYYIMSIRFNHAAERVYADSSFKAVQSGQFAQALYQYDVLMKLNSGNAFYYFYRGVAKFSINRLRDAIPDWETAVKMDVKDVQMSASYNLSVAYDSVGKDSLAAFYIKMAKEKGYAVNPDFYNKIIGKYERRRKH